MPYFFFHLRSGDVVLADDEGVAVASPQEAVIKGHVIAREMASKEGVGERFLNSTSVEVVDEKGVIWATIPLRLSDSSRCR